MNVFVSYDNAKKYLTLVVVIVSVVVKSAFAQDKAKIKAEANASAGAFLKGDYATMANYIYPKLLASMGGKSGFVYMLTTQVAAMKKRGLTLEREVIGQPGEIYPSGTNLLCLVPQTVTVKMQSRYITTTTYLLAVSEDKGKIWTFVDTSNGPSEKLKTMFPIWNEKLVIPNQSKPIYSDKMP